MAGLAFDIAIQQKHVWFAVLIALGMFGLFSAIFLYHWRTYLKQTSTAVLMETTYFVGAGVIIIMMLISAGLF